MSAPDIIGLYPASHAADTDSWPKDCDESASAGYATRRNYEARLTSPITEFHHRAVRGRARYIQVVPESAAIAANASGRRPRRRSASSAR